MYETNALYVLFDTLFSLTVSVNPFFPCPYNHSLIKFYYNNICLISLGVLSLGGTEFYINQSESVKSKYCYVTESML
ncbi:MAG: hypothetical protein K0Q47_1995 [Sedimentibacter sp.]|nr:hypothetical protein [Sedimentibacter sp.]